MLLAIDIGNSHTVIGVFAGQALVHHWRLTSNRNQTGDEIALNLRGLFGMGGLSPADLAGAILASVVPQVNGNWLAACRDLGLSPLLVDHQTPAGMPILIDNPAELGADRIVNAVAAYRLHRQALIVVDFGTAITFDCVSARGEYLGGAIAPGLGIAIEALGSRTARLPRVDINVSPPPVIGTNTVTAIQSGILYGYGGLVEGLIARMRERFAPQNPKVIATGGMAELIAPYAPSLTAIEPWLTLEGLRLLHELRS